MNNIKYKLRKWVAKVRFSKLVYCSNQNLSPFEDSTEYIKATYSLLQISRKGQNFVDIVLLAISLLSVEDPATPGCLYHFLDATALPKPQALLQLNSRMVQLFQKPLQTKKSSRRRAMCAVVWSILASKLAGKASAQILNKDVSSILMESIKLHQPIEVRLFSLMAIQSFIATRENKIKLKKLGLPSLLSSLLNSSGSPLPGPLLCTPSEKHRLEFLIKINLRRFGVDSNFSQKLSTELNCALDWRGSDSNLDFSDEFLEVRNNLPSFITIAGTHSVKKSKWYYEVELLTAGTIQIGWATNQSNFSSYNGVGVGDESHSFSFDGSRQVCWFFQDTFSHGCSKWKPGDVVGCYLNLSNWSAIFYVNGIAVDSPIQLPPDEMSKYLDQEGGFRPAISLTVFEHVRVNFGYRPFKFPPPKGCYRDFNHYGSLDNEFREGPPALQTTLDLSQPSITLTPNEEDNLCKVCFDATKDVVLFPCQHDGLCGSCVSKIEQCPFCREAVQFWHLGQLAIIGEPIMPGTTSVLPSKILPTSLSSSKTSLSLYHDASTHLSEGITFVN